MNDKKIYIKNVKYGRGEVPAIIIDANNLPSDNDISSFVKKDLREFTGKKARKPGKYVSQIAVNNVNPNNIYDVNSTVYKIIGDEPVTIVYYVDSDNFIRMYQRRTTRSIQLSIKGKKAYDLFKELHFKQGLFENIETIDYSSNDSDDYYSIARIQTHADITYFDFKNIPFNDIKLFLGLVDKINEQETQGPDKFKTFGFIDEINNKYDKVEKVLSSKLGSNINKYVNMSIELPFSTAHRRVSSSYDIVNEPPIDTLINIIDTISKAEGDYTQYDIYPLSKGYTKKLIETFSSGQNQPDFSEINIVPRSETGSVIKISNLGDDNVMQIHLAYLSLALERGTIDSDVLDTITKNSIKTNEVIITEFPRETGISISKNKFIDNVFVRGKVKARKNSELSKFLNNLLSFLMLNHVC